MVGGNWDASQRYVHQLSQMACLLTIDALFRVPAGWVRHISMDGRIYYHHPAKKMFTYEDITDTRVRAFLLREARETIASMREDGFLSLLPTDYEIELDLYSLEDRVARIGITCYKARKTFCYVGQRECRAFCSYGRA